MLSSTSIKPAELILNIPSELPFEITNAVAASPVVVTVITSSPFAALSARLAVWPDAMIGAISVTVTVTVMVSVLAPSVTESTTAHVFASFPVPQPGVS